MVKTKELLEWEKKHDAYEQMKIIKNWCEYESYDYISKPLIHSVEELVTLYRFVVFTCDVEFVSSVYDLIGEEAEEGDTTTADLCRTFNEELGRRYWQV